MTGKFDIILCNKYWATCWLIQQRHSCENTLMAIGLIMSYFHTIFKKIKLIQIETHLEPISVSSFFVRAFPILLENLNFNYVHAKKYSYTMRVIFGSKYFYCIIAT